MKKSKLYLAVCFIALTPFAAQANSLLDIYELSLKNDAQLKADKAGYEAGRESSNIGLAGLLPQINAQYQYNDTDTDTGNNLKPGPVAKSKSTTKGWALSLNQPLFDMSLWYNYKQSQKLSAQAEAQFGADQQSLIVRVATAYFNVLRAVDQLEATLSEKKALSHQLEQTKQRFDVGLTAITEVHEAQAASDSATAATLEARGRLSISYEALEVLTGQPEDSISPLADKFPVVNPTPADRAEWVGFSLKNNYNLKAAKLHADAAEDTASATRAGHYPTVSATLSRNDNDTDGSNVIDGLYDRNAKGNSVTVTASIPLFSGGGTSARTRQAVSQELQAQEQYNGTQRSVIQNTRSLHLSVETDVARVEARKQAIVSNQSALEATQAGYEVGTRNLVEVLLAQRNLYQARRDYSNALYDYVIDSISLREVAGMLTPADIQEVDKWLQTGNNVSRSKYEK